MSLNGDFIAVFDKMEEAAKQTGSDYSQISRCCRGKAKTCNGYKWKFDNSDLKIKTDPLDRLLDFL